jgi:hypothetical protein
MVRCVVIVCQSCRSSRRHNFVAGKYMIKTQSKTESKFLRRILPHYYRVRVQFDNAGDNHNNSRVQYIMDNPNTLITRFYGMHRVKVGVVLRP